MMLNQRVSKQRATERATHIVIRRNIWANQFEWMALKIWQIEFSAIRWVWVIGVDSFVVHLCPTLLLSCASLVVVVHRDTNQPTKFRCTIFTFYFIPHVGVAKTCECLSRFCFVVFTITTKHKTPYNDDNLSVRNMSNRWIHHSRWTPSNAKIIITKMKIECEMVCIASSSW